MKTFLFGCAAFASLAGTALSAPAVPKLTAPTMGVPMQIAIRLPAGMTLDANSAWQLVDTAGENEGIPATLVPAQDRDGAAVPNAQTLVATIPASATATGQRQFKVVAAPARALEAFRMADVNDKSLGLWEGARPVFVYNHGVLSRPDVPADRSRSTYLHPIYGLDGEILTDDFPKDHYHHRGLFWAWPHVRIEDKNYDLWDLRGIEQRFERWIERRTGTAAAVLAVENGWFIGARKVMQERVWFTVYPVANDAQVLDVSFTWIPIGQPIALAGAEEKSYGGLTLRFAPRTGTVITTPLGSKTDDLAMTRLPWADLSAHFAGAPGSSGAAIFIDPQHPDYPPTWLTRHYGALCVGWPGVAPQTFPSGQPIHCAYRVWIHRGAATDKQLAHAYAAYQALSAVTWPE